MRRRTRKHPLAAKVRLRLFGPAIERRKSNRPNPSRSGDTQRLRVTVKLPDSLVEHARDAVMGTPGLTFMGLVERSLTTYIEQLEKQRGKAFPPRRAQLRVGRPRRPK